MDPIGYATQIGALGDANNNKNIFGQIGHVAQTHRLWAPTSIIVVQYFCDSLLNFVSNSDSVFFQITMLRVRGSAAERILKTLQRVVSKRIWPTATAPALHAVDAVCVLPAVGYRPSHYVKFDVSLIQHNTTQETAALTAELSKCRCPWAASCPPRQVSQNLQ